MDMQPSLITDPAGILSGFFGGVFAWFVTSFVAKPLIDFSQARSVAAQYLTMFAEADVFDPEKDEPEEDLIIERKKLLKEAGAQLVAFDLSNQFVAKLLRKLKFCPRQAGENLILLAEMKWAGGQNDQLRGQVMHYLRLGRKFGHTRI